MAPLRCAAKFDPILSLDCAPTPFTLAASKEMKGSNVAIWQPCFQAIILAPLAAEGEQCHYNEDCQENLLCDGNMYTCRKHARDGTYSGSFCSQGKGGILCQDMEGDCDKNGDCEGSLRCGSDNCPWISNGADCCYKP